MRVDPCSVPYPNVETPHLHPFPFRKGSGEKLRTPENVAVVRHHPALSNVLLFARRDLSKPDRRWRAT